MLVFTELLVSNLGVATDDVDAWCGGDDRRRLEEPLLVRPASQSQVGIALFVVEKMDDA